MSYRFHYKKRTLTDSNDRYRAFFEGVDYDHPCVDESCDLRHLKIADEDWFDDDDE